MSNTTAYVPASSQASAMQNWVIALQLDPAEGWGWVVYESANPSNARDGSFYNTPQEALAEAYATLQNWCNPS
jgi:hypothetical protein